MHDSEPSSRGFREGYLSHLATGCAQWGRSLKRFSHRLPVTNARADATLQFSAPGDFRPREVPRIQPARRPRHLLRVSVERSSPPRVSAKPTISSGISQGEPRVADRHSAGPPETRGIAQLSLSLVQRRFAGRGPWPPGRLRERTPGTTACTGARRRVRSQRSGPELLRPRGSVPSDRRGHRDAMCRRSRRPVRLADCEVG